MSSYNLARKMEGTSKSKDEKKQKKIKFYRLKYSLAFIIFEAIFTSFVFTMIVFYGPFINVKKAVVGALVTSGKHGYIAKWFLSDAEINNLTNHQTAINSMKNSTEKINVNAINIANKNNTNIERYDVIGKKFKGYILVIHDPTRVKVGVTKNIGTEGELTSQIAEDNNAVAAINGGGFSDVANAGNSLYTGTGGKPVGILMSKGEVISDNAGKINEKVTTMGITNEGKLLVGNYSIQDLKENKVTEAISFSPILVLNGKAHNIEESGGLAPRTAIGQTKDGDILFLVIDGRQLSSVGATYEDVQNIMLQYGAENAINLDGGSSTAMYYNGEIINNPSDAAGERYVPSAIYVGN